MRQPSYPARRCRRRSPRCRSTTGRSGSPSTWSSGAAPYLSTAFVEENFDFYSRTLTGTEEMRDRWKRGVDSVRRRPRRSGRRGVRRARFPPEAKAQMDELVANLVEAYRVSIGRLDWMSAETRGRALEKLEPFRSKIGYPDRGATTARWRSTATT